MKCKKKSDNMSMFFEYMTSEGKFEVCVRYLSEEEVEMMMESSKKVTWKRHQRVDQLDERKFRHKFLNEAICGLRGAKIKHIPYLIEPTMRIELTGKEKWEDEVNLTADLKTTIIENINAEFNTFVFAAAREIGAYVEKTRIEEEQNLKPGSGTEKATKS